jgi:hypothetical protein
MRAEEIKGLIEAYSKVHETPEVLSEETEQLDEAPGGPARFWDSNMGKFVTKVSNAAKAAGEYLAPSPERSAEPSVRAGVRTPQTGFSHVASMDRAPTSTARPTRRETPAQREARISRAQDAAIAAADKAEKAKAKAKPEPGSNRPGPSGTPGGTPSNVISAKNIAGQSQKVTVGRKYGATLGGQKGSVTYDSSGKRTFVADKPSTAAEKPTTTPSPSNKPSPSPTPTTKPSAMDQWRAANPKLAAAADEKARIRGTSQTDNPLMKDMRSKMSMTPSVQSPTLAKDLGKGSGNQSLLNNPNASKAAPPKPAATATPKPTAAAKPSGFDLAKKGVNLASDVDIFDLVKGHLLDEGYAETEQNAIVMMANMSEEWRNSILETHGVDLEETKKWIQKAIKHPGALHKELGVPEDEKIPTGKLEIAAKKGGKMGKRARLAMTLKGLKKN